MHICYTYGNKGESYTTIGGDIPNDDSINELPVMYNVWLHVNLPPILSHITLIVITTRLIRMSRLFIVMMTFGNVRNFGWNYSAIISHVGLKKVDDC